ncbi:30S ribosome-binding factor RbfA [Buchnera aphidicola]|uniref:Ribosome-binding factor A n=1 Tax=Buchnera aphidicola (Cinara strobi) TaxID=1921549 RepID=A0A3B1DWF3_9GAMM|nr:30S ribosome-binding factor RbfA [Buchnera aphidicola]VAX76623.1 30S ribosome-binding factor [Buchnera aphidicola (Cinara strobi)]
MLKGCHRAVKLERNLHKEIAIIIQQRLKDPRLNEFITISEVKLSLDLSYAKIFVTFLKEKNKKKIKLMLFVLQRSSSYIRSILNKNIYLRIVPKLFFIHDVSFLNGIFISKLIDKNMPS